MSHYLGKRILNIIRSKLARNQGNSDEPSGGFAGSFSEDTNYTGDSSNSTGHESNQQPPENEEQRHLGALEISSYKDFSDIKRAYRKMSLAYHPDKFANDSEKLAIANEVQGQINEAYQYFKDKLKS